MGALGVHRRLVLPEPGHRQRADGLSVGGGGAGQALPDAAADEGVGVTFHQGPQVAGGGLARAEDDHMAVHGRAAHHQRLVTGAFDALGGQPVAQGGVGLQHVDAGGVGVQQARPESGGDPPRGDGVLDHQQLEDRQPQVGGGSAEPDAGRLRLVGGEQEFDHLCGVSDDVRGVPVEGFPAGDGQHAGSRGVPDAHQAQMASVPVPRGGRDPSRGDVRGEGLVQRQRTAAPHAGRRRQGDPLGPVEQRARPHLLVQVCRQHGQPQSQSTTRRTSRPAGRRCSSSSRAQSGCPAASVAVPCAVSFPPVTSAFPSSSSPCGPDGGRYPTGRRGSSRRDGAGSSSGG